MDIEKVKNLLSPLLNDLGYELYSLKSRKDKSDIILEVVIDRREAINLDDIVDVTNKINELLDKEDPIEESYLLDISSLGAEKPLKIESLKDYEGEYVNIHLTNPIDGNNIYEGYLKEVRDDEVTISYKIKTKDKEFTTPKDNIYKIRLAIK